MAREADLALIHKDIFSGSLWPVHLKPKDDELLSSWLMRLAMAHGQKLHTFCSITWPGKSIWNRDIDKSADTRIIHTLADKTGTTIRQARATTLASFEGILYEKHNHLGPSAWIMPIGIYHRTRRLFGLQYCPQCLNVDAEPYYRRKWRLAFMAICEKHHILLNDRCPQCEAAVNFHRNELGDYRKFVAASLTHCHICNFDLRDAPVKTSPYPITFAEVEFTQRLLQSSIDGYVQVAEMEWTYSHLFFTVLRQLMKVAAAKGKRLDTLRQDISHMYDIEVYIPSGIRPQLDVQEQDVQNRRQLLQIARYLLSEWPYRFISIAQKHKIWSSTWLRHLESCPWERSRQAPFWFWRVVHDYLYRARYCPSDEEISKAIKYLTQSGHVLSKSAIARLLGITVIRRNGDIS